MAQAGLCPKQSQETQQLVTLRTNLSLSSLRGKPAHACSSKHRPDFSQPLLVSVVPQPAKGSHPHCVGQNLWLSLLTLQGGCLNMYPPYSSESSPKDTSVNFINFLLFLCNYMHVFPTVLFVQEFFCQSPAMFQ